MRCKSNFILLLFSFLLISSLAVASFDFPFTPSPKPFNIDLIHSVIVISETKVTSTIDIFFGNFSDYDDEVLKLDLKGSNITLFLDNKEIEYKRGLSFNVTELINHRLHITLTRPLVFESYLGYKTIFIDDLKFYSSNSLAVPNLKRHSIKFIVEGELDFVENSYTSKHEGFLYYQNENSGYSDMQITIKRKGIDNNKQADELLSSFNWLKFLKVFLLIIIIPVLIFLIFKSLILFNAKKKEYDDIYDYILKYEQMGYSRQKLVDWLSSQGHSVDSIKKIIETHEKKKKDLKLLSKNKR